MFHTGDLNSGIGRAIAEGKLVACFVKDGNDESRVWEEEWLGETEAPGASATRGHRFATKAVILRIAWASDEASFLSAFCPVTKAPAFVIIHNGQVVDKLEASLHKHEFIARASQALGLDSYEAPGSTTTANIAYARDPMTQTRQDSATDDSGIGGAAGASRATSSGIRTPDSTDTVAAAVDTSEDLPPSPTTQLQREANMTSLFPDRAQRMEAEKSRREATEKAERLARQNARRKEAEEAHAAHGGKGKADDALQKEKARRDWLVQQKQRKGEAKQEKERILRQIEADKQERKDRTRAAQRSADEAPTSPLPPATQAASRRRMGAGGVCNLSIRLFDGSSVKGRFEPSATLANNVRAWIKEETTDQGNPHASDVPFTFKQILTPLPSRNIEISEENQSLAELGLPPNATLVLLPVNGYTEAYSDRGGRGYMSTALHAAHDAAGTVTGLVSSALSYFPGLGGATTSIAESTTPVPVSENHAPASSSIKVKTLADQRAETMAVKKQDQQNEFYNGNSSAFQGRKDDDDQGPSGGS